VLPKYTCIENNSQLISKQQRNDTNISLCSVFYVAAVKTTLLAFAAERRAAVDVDRKAAADAPCSNRSISTVRRAHSSKPAAAAVPDGTDRQTDEHRYILYKQC